MADIFSAESRLIHAGTERVSGQPATPPLAPASIYVSQGTPRPGRGYGRDGNPGWEALEQALGGLEDAEAVTFASGQAALPLRIARQSASALAIAGHLAGHPRVTAVHYPGIDGPGVDKTTSALARRQMPDGFGPLLSFEVTPDSADAADKVVARSQLILPATSFGGVESTWERRARWPAETAPPGLIRLSVGVEPVADLIADIDQALEVL
jgi:cystathionine beta-lyase/cystathionine gamma-synthase